MQKFNRLTLEKIILYSVILILFGFYFIHYFSFPWLGLLFFFVFTFHIVLNYYTRNDSTNKGFIFYLELLLAISLLLLIFNKIPTSL